MIKGISLVDRIKIAMLDLQTDIEFSKPLRAVVSQDTRSSQKNAKNTAAKNEPVVRSKRQSESILAEFIYRLYHYKPWTADPQNSQMPKLEPVVGFSYDSSLPQKVINELGIKSEVGMDLSRVLCILGDGLLLSTPTSDGFVFTRYAMLVYQQKDMKNPIHIRYDEIGRIDSHPPTEINILKKKSAYADCPERYCVHTSSWNHEIICIILRFVSGTYDFYRDNTLPSNISVEEMVGRIAAIEMLDGPEEKEIDRPQGISDEQTPTKEISDIDSGRNKLEYDKAQIFEVVVASTMSSGKSTFINALIGEELLPSRNQACTARITAVLDNDGAQSITGHVLFSDGRYERIDACTPERMADILDKQKDSLADLVVECSIPGVRNIGRSLLIVDTPGANNSGDFSHGETTREYLQGLTSGLVVYIINAAQISTCDNMDLLQFIQATLAEKPDVDILFILNKADEFDIELEPIQQAVASCTALLKNAGFDNVPLIPVSSAAALLFKKALAGVSMSKMERANFLQFYSLFETSDFNLASYALTPGTPDPEEVCNVHGQEFKRKELLVALENTGLPAVERAIEDHIVKQIISKAPEIQAPF